MERRYDLLFEVGFRDITGYNAAYDRGELGPAPGAPGARAAGGGPAGGRRSDEDAAPRSSGCRTSSSSSTSSTT